MNTDFWRSKRVLVTGASGFVGRNLVPLLRKTGCELITPAHTDYDLLEQEQVRRLLADTKPNLVFHLAGLIGGIMANKIFPADFCYKNILMNTMIMQESLKAGVKKYITLIGGCSYPEWAPNPIKETEIWNGYPHPDSAPYSVAKKMNIVMADAFRRQYGFNAVVLVPGNLYGPYDNYDLQNSHVIPATILKFWKAKQKGDKKVIVWGTGEPIRDFIYIEDACEAILIAAENYNSSEIVNISSGVKTTIRELIEVVAELLGFNGEIVWDTSKPNGQLKKCFDVTRMREWLGYKCHTSLRDGIKKTIEWFESINRISKI